MVWYLVDDGFYSQPEVLTIPRDQRAAAAGVWTLCGAWCARNLTDGRIAHSMALEIGCSQEGIDALVAAKIWKRIKGSRYQYVNWVESGQQTREKVEEKRERDRERKTIARHGSPPDPSNPPGVSARTPRGVRAPYPIPTTTTTKDLTVQSVGTPRAQAKSSDGPVDKSVEAVERAVRDEADIALAPMGALVLIDHYSRKAPPGVRSMPGYLSRCIRNEDPFVLRKLIHDNDLEAS